VIFDLIRSAAAFAVLFGHTFNIIPLPAWPHPGYWLQQYGVVVFFLLSGYLISQTLHRRLARPESTFTDYAIDRWSRIYSGFLPALLVVALIDWFTTSGLQVAHPETAARYTAQLFVGNFLMLQSPVIMLPFGSGAPFWTVAIEFWIYMFVGLIAFTARDGLTFNKAVAIFATGIIPVQSFGDNYCILVAWLLGALAERLNAAGLFNRFSRTELLIAAGAALAYLTHRTMTTPFRIYDLKVYFAAAVVFAAIVAIATRSKPRDGVVSDIAKWFSSWSYSLYLLHHTIVFEFARTFGGGFGPWWSIWLSVLASISFASLTEAHHRQLADWIKYLVRHAQKNQAGIVAIFLHAPRGGIRLKTSDGLEREVRRGGLEAANVDSGHRREAEQHRERLPQSQP
jgi:peptidoglycan/LPS O-acetylase OafA/YrhL